MRIYCIYIYEPRDLMHHSSTHRYLIVGIYMCAFNKFKIPSMVYTLLPAYIYIYKIYQPSLYLSLSLYLYLCFGATRAFPLYTYNIFSSVLPGGALGNCRVHKSPVPDPEEIMGIRWVSSRRTMTNGYRLAAPARAPKVYMRSHNVRIVV